MLFNKNVSLEISQSTKVNEIINYPNLLPEICSSSSISNILTGLVVASYTTTEVGRNSLDSQSGARCKSHSIAASDSILTSMFTQHGKHD